MAIKNDDVKDSILVQFGTKLREIREKSGVSQEKLAIKAGIHRNYVGILERGEQNPSLIILIKLAKALEINLTEFINSLGLN